MRLLNPKGNLSGKSLRKRGQSLDQKTNPISRHDTTITTEEQFSTIRTIFPRTEDITASLRLFVFSKKNLEMKAVSFSEEPEVWIAVALYQSIPSTLVYHETARPYTTSDCRTACGTGDKRKRSKTSPLRSGIRLQSSRRF
ncbi:unnamed protein product, partial [Ectocarpus sp. 13 AM-2016]